VWTGFVSFSVVDNAVDPKRQDENCVHYNKKNRSHLNASI